MTSTLPGADIRGFYRALGIELPAGDRENVCVRCFARPEEHRRGDRNPSLSIDMITGAWKCHGCGSDGGAYDAATTLGRSRSAAMDLLIQYGIAPGRPHGADQPFSAHARHGSLTSAQSAPVSVRRRSLDVRESEIQHWRQRLHPDAPIIDRLGRDRGWRYPTVCDLELGLDRGRITIPVRDEHRTLVGLLRYQPWTRAGQNKMRAAAGSRRQLLPHPATEPSQHVLLVEGEPDMIAARSRGLPAIAVPGVDAWRPEWAPMFAGREVTIVMDADRPGHLLAPRIAGDLASHATPTIIDVAPHRDDGYDLTDWLLDHPEPQDPNVLLVHLYGYALAS